MPNLLPLRALALLALLATAGCSSCTKTPGGTTPPPATKRCTASADCPAGQFCAKDGSCKAGCRADAECPGAGICHADGTCGVRPECALDTDCPAAFICQAGKCACSTDYACWTGGSNGQPVDTSKICEGGACVASTSCSADDQCTEGRYCGPAGVCTAPCKQNSDCGGASQLGGALTCSSGRCTAPCFQDSVPAGAQGGCKDYEICQSGVCAPSQCRTFADCGDPGLLCTDAKHGRCQAYTTCDPTAPEACGPQAECRQYSFNECPPGFDCSKNVCVDLPPCFTDNQCEANQVCDLGGCRTAPACADSSTCTAFQDCIGGHCVPHVCRGTSDCTAGKICSGGRCVAPPDGADIVAVRLLTPPTTLEVGGSRQLAAVALTASGQSKPVPHFDWSVTPASVATVSASGLLAGAAAGAATVTVGFTRPDGSQATPDSATFQVLAAPAAGRVVVVDSARGAPIAGALVRVCAARDAAGACTDAQDLTTGADGTAAFNLPDGGGPLDVSAADPANDAAGKPVHDVVHLLGVAARDLLVPLPGNQAGEAAGFTGSIDFNQVHSQGNTNVGLAGASIADLASFQLQDLVGQQPWVSTVNLPQNPFPGIPGQPGPGQGFDFDGGALQVPLSGAVVLGFTQVGGLNVPLPVKDQVYALGSAGVRSGWAFAGKVNPQLVLGSITTGAQNGTLSAVLPFFGAFDHGLRAAVDLPLKPEVLDQSDLNGDGVCEDSGKCATGGQSLPDYLHFPNTIFRPSQPQSLRAEVELPPAPTGAAQTILVAGAQIPGAGLLPLGMIGANGGGSTVLRMAPLYGGLEASDYALLALATGGGGGGGPPGPDGGVPNPGNGGAVSARVLRADPLPTSVALADPFVPFVDGAHYDPASRSFSPGPGWADVASATQVVRLALVGGRQRAFVYASPQAAAAGLRVPEAPGAPAYDPATDPAAQGSVAALALPPADSLDELVSLPGDTLLDLSSRVTGLSRAPLQ